MAKSRIERGFLLTERAVTQLKAFEFVVFGVEQPMTRVTLNNADVRDEIAIPTPSERRRPFAHEHVDTIHP